MGADTGAMVRGSSLVQPQHSRHHGSSSARRYGPDQCWLSSFYSPDFQSVRATISPSPRRTRSKPATPGSGPCHSSTYVVSGLRWFFCCFCVCHCCTAWRPTGLGLGSLVSTLDARGLGLSDSGNCSWKLVGLLRTRLGRVVVLGSGRKCVIHALVGWHSVNPLARGHRETWRL